MYKITAVIHKPGGTPTIWTRFSEKELSKSECEKMLSSRKAVGKSHEEVVSLDDFICTKADITIM